CRPESQARMSLLLLLGVLVGVTGFYFGLKCAIRNVQDVQTHRPVVSWSGLLPMIVSVCVGAALASFCYSTSYPYGTMFRIDGIPFPEAGFERHGDGWIDFVGPLTLPFCIANALFGFLIAQCLLQIYRRMMRPSSPSRAV